jgi:UDP:flavonoid glycosyltransferase YjiC (YdhE family)
VPGFQPGLRAMAGDEVFLYLRGFALRSPEILAALAGLSRPVRAYLPDAAPAARAALAAAGIALEDEPLPLAGLLARSACALHHGGVGLAAAFLAAGLPQVILSKQLDNRLAGEFVAREGLGFHAPLGEADAGWIGEAVARAAADADLRARCLARAPDFDDWFAYDPTARVAEEAARLVARAY